MDSNAAPPSVTRSATASLFWARIGTSREVFPQNEFRSRRAPSKSTAARSKRSRAWPISPSRTSSTASSTSSLASSSFGRAALPFTANPTTAMTPNTAAAAHSESAIRRCVRGSRATANSTTTVVTPIPMIALVPKLASAPRRDSTRTETAAARARSGRAPPITTPEMSANARARRPATISSAVGATAAATAPAPTHTHHGALAAAHDADPAAPATRTTSATA